MQVGVWVRAIASGHSSDVAYSTDGGRTVFSSGGFRLVPDGWEYECDVGLSDVVCAMTDDCRVEVLHEIGRMAGGRIDLNGDEVVMAELMGMLSRGRGVVVLGEGMFMRNSRGLNVVVKSDSGNHMLKACSVEEAIGLVLG